MAWFWNPAIQGVLHGLSDNNGEGTVTQETIIAENIQVYDYMCTLDKEVCIPSFRVGFHIDMIAVAC